MVVQTYLCILWKGGLYKYEYFVDTLQDSIRQMQQKYLTIKSSIHEYEALPHNLKPEDQKAPSAYTFIFTACKSHLRSQPGIFMLVRNKGIAEWNFLIQWNYLEVFISPQECFFFLLVLDTANSFISKSCYNYKTKEDSKSHFLHIYMLNIKWYIDIISPLRNQLMGYFSGFFETQVWGEDYNPRSSW